MVVKHGSAAIAYIANTVRLPLVAIAFHLRPVMGNRVLKWDSQGSLFNFAGLFFILTGLVLFLSRKLGLYVVVKKYLLEMAKKYYEEKQLQEQLMQHQAQQHRLFQQQQQQRTGRPSSSLSSSRNSAHRHHHHSRHQHNPPRRHHRQHQNPYRHHRHDREEIEALLSSDDASSQPQRMTVN
ncbi:SEC7 domain-containing protein [Balamuthia mandrillaris]